MVNESRGEVAITIGGKEHIVRLGFDGVKRLEKATGKSALWLMRNAETQASVDFVTVCLLIALRKGPFPKLTEEQLLEWMDQEPERFDEWLPASLRLMALALQGRKLKELEDKIKAETEAGPTSPPEATTGEPETSGTGSDS